MSPTARRLSSVLALGLGTFLVLVLLPFSVTGSLGQRIGPGLWRAFGIGATGFPMIFILVGLAGFDRLPRLDQKRAAILTAGATLLLPYLIGVITRVDQASFLSVHAEWSSAAVLTGWFPGFLATSVRDNIGVGGGLVLGFVLLTGLTLSTLAWHPLIRLEKGSQAVPELKPGKPMRNRELLPEPPVEEIAPPPPEEHRQEDLFADPVESGAARYQQLDLEEALSEAASGEIGDSLLPPVELLNHPIEDVSGGDDAALDELGERLLATLRTFKVDGSLAGRTSGPTVSQFEIVPAPGVKAGRIIALADDLAIGMRVTSLRVTTIPDRGAIGVEIPSPRPRIVTVGGILQSSDWARSNARLPIALGSDVEGRPVIADLARMPHLLVAGATGAGKSVAINTIITSLIYRYPPKDLRFLMIDPKMVELSIYSDLPHLRHPVVTNSNDAATVLKWAVYEMNRRYELLHANGARQLSDFNQKVREGRLLRNPPGARPTLISIAEEAPDTPPPAQPWSDEYQEGELPMVVLVVDEFADLMMTVQGEVETPLAMLAQKARAIGIHLILATQRPSVNVLTGLIKANFPSRIAFRVASKVDSRTILDQNGAESLLGNGDMLFLPPGRNEPQRIQGAYISTAESERLMEWYRQQMGAGSVTIPTEPDILEVIRSQGEGDSEPEARAGGESRDPLFRQAAELCVQHDGGSTSLLQRRMGIGYGRAARIIDQLHEVGVLGPPNGSKPREVLIGLHQLDEYVG